MPTQDELKKAEEVLEKLLKASAWEVSNDTELSATRIIATALTEARKEGASAVYLAVDEKCHAVAKTGQDELWKVWRAARSAAEKINEK